MIIIYIENSQILFVFQTVSNTGSTGLCYSVVIKEEHMKADMSA